MFTNSGMPGIFKKGDWYAELKNIMLRRVHVYGDPFTGIATVTITDGELHIEGLICNTPFTSKDREDIHSICMDFGFTYYMQSSFGDDGERVHKRVELS